MRKTRDRDRETNVSLTQLGWAECKPVWKSLICRANHSDTPASWRRRQEKDERDDAGVGISLTGPVQFVLEAILKRMPSGSVVLVKHMVTCQV